MRTSIIARQTNETNISLELNIDGSGTADISINCGFLEHMLNLFASHGKFDLKVKCEGDIYVDAHHSAEDLGITLGKAFKEGLGDFRGINRYGHCILPMDESLILSAVDLSGRSCCCCSLEGLNEKVGDMDTECIIEFFEAFARNLDAAIHIKKLDGKNTHHILEGSFKSLARSLRIACSIDADFKDEIPSTKGCIL